MSIIFSGFEWDKGTSDKSRLKHGVTCEEAEKTFLGKNFVFPDLKHSTPTEERFILFGETRQNKPLLVAFTVRDKKARVISARPMSQKERTWYEKEKRDQNY